MFLGPILLIFFHSNIVKLLINYVYIPNIIVVIILNAYIILKAEQIIINVSSWTKKTEGNIETITMHTCLT